MIFKVTLFAGPVIVIVSLVALLIIVNASLSLSFILVTLVTAVCSAAVGVFCPEPPSDTPQWIKRIREGSSRSR
jgi:hypothetical protein